MWLVPLMTTPNNLKSKGLVLVAFVLVISLSSSSIPRVTGLQWEDVDGDSVIITAPTDEELQSLISNGNETGIGSRHKRQFGQFPGIGGAFPGFQLQFPPGWPFNPQVGLPPNPTPTMPSQIGSCLTRNGGKGKCATLRQCYPVLYSSIEGDDESGIRNPVLADIFRDASGPCDTHTMPNFLLFRADAAFRQNLICCGGSGGGSTQRPVSIPTPPSINNLFHPQITMRPPWAQIQTTKAPIPVTAPTHPPTQRTTTQQNQWPNWPPQAPTHPPTQRTTTQQSQWPNWPPQVPTNPPSIQQPQPPQQPGWPPSQRPTTPTTVAPAPVSSSCGFAKIVGGTQATKGEFPWLVALMKNGRQFCGGSLIDSLWILTAAHCVQAFTEYDLPSIKAQIGDYDIYSNADGPVTIKGITRIVRHAGFSHQTLHNDIALLKLASPVQIGNNGNNNIQPICLAQSGGYEGTTATVAGWGGLYENGPQPAIYRKVELPVWQNQQCAAKYGQYAPGGITSHMVCAGSSAKDACRGDSGGPLMRNSGGRWQQIGVVSWGIGCGKYPGVYSRLDFFKDWIARNRNK